MQVIVTINAGSSMLETGPEAFFGRIRRMWSCTSSVVTGEVGRLRQEVFDHLVRVWGELVFNGVSEGLRSISRGVDNATLAMKWSVGLLLPSECPGDFPDAADTTVSLRHHLSKTHVVVALSHRRAGGVALPTCSYLKRL
ncbi:hypothetical protein J6590_072176 [Homalodisca vitripennis]|nr:hypothetical protein J6590_072176 [Homalodisca vitripennis]